MAEQLVTIKTSKLAQNQLRLLAAQYGLKQYEVMEVVFEMSRWGLNSPAHQLLLDKAANK